MKAAVMQPFHLRMLDNEAGGWAGDAGWREAKLPDGRLQRWVEGR